MSRHRPSHQGTGTTVRLVALVLLPVTVMCGLAGSDVLARRATATRAVAVEHRVTALSRLVTFRDALDTQESLQAMTVRLANLGVTPEVASGYIGVDLVEWLASARRSANRALLRFGVGSPVEQAELRAFYAGHDSGALSPVQALARLTTYVSVTNLAVKQTLKGLDLAGREAKIVAPIEALAAVTDLADVATAQGIDLSALWFPDAGQTPAAAAAVFALLGRNTANYDSKVTRVRSLGVPQVTAGLDRMEADASVRAFTAAAHAALLRVPSEGPLVDLTTVASVFRGYLLRDERLRSLSAAAIAAVLADSSRLASDSRRDFLLWLLGAALLAFTSIGVAMLLARSIARPLKALAEYAHAVNEGEIDLDPPSGRHRGPRETRVACAALGDVVRSLRLLDAKANALAHCAFTDPVLQIRLPGRLGESLQSSVTVLSESIMQRDELQSDLTHQATHDSLTGLHNRSAAVVAIQSAMDRATRTAATTAVLFVDLDDFKLVNDRQGHEGGDEVLRQVAGRMASVLRGGDVVARFGGDEFVVVAQEMVDVGHVTDLARRVLEAINLPMDIAGQQVQLGASIGIALSLDGPEDPMQLIARADAAMYRAKQHPGSAIEIFDAHLQDQLVHRTDIECALSAALREPGGGGLRLNYQPIFEAATQALVGVEALVRWERPGHGVLAPDDFIPVAEATSLILDLDRWVIDQAVDQLVVWADLPALAGVPLSVNVSGRHLLSGKLPGHLAAALARTRVDPTRLIVEITETVVLEDLVLAASELQSVRALGVKVAIDDFGTGFTSLAHLQQLPMDIIKIDRSFIRQLDAQRGWALVEMVTVFGHSMDITIIAEGVETAAELSALQAMGADQLQGYLLSRPLEVDALETWARHAVQTAGSARV